MRFSWKGLVGIVFKHFAGKDKSDVMHFLCTKQTLIELLMLETAQVQRICPLEVCASLRHDCTAGIFPTIFELVAVILVVPVQTAAVERGFSMHCIVKKLLNKPPEYHDTPIIIVQMLT